MYGYEFAVNWLEEPHILIAGCTGSGKSVLLNDILFTLTGYGYTERKMILIDLKRVELKKWSKFPHTHECITEPEQVIPCLDNVIRFMEYRYKKMERLDQEMSTDGDLYIIIDELAEVLRIKGTEERIDTLLRLARACRIHLIMATQNPARTGKGSIPASIQKNVSVAVGLRCRSAVESRQIIGINGCEQLPRYGHAIVFDSNGYHHLGIPFVTREMIEDRRLENVILECIN